eukprot:Protomagalhaensia_sp_Gyna_25__4873@NODE_50_length_6124_cov_50_591454_g37_i0_p4_GENE_NODE_50_length_6124_cov_50_591454_g37_i0NODE_50_length_6124_cov_50_591454_g37_i0_p4_ORF_typecomplete_len287_score46_90_NODE_50_length_6124_cov_50_591454_g37_i034954355
MLLWWLLAASVRGTDFEPGDIPLEWRQLATEDIAAMMGRWRLITEESDSIEDILYRLNVGWLKRRALRNYASITEIGVTQEAVNAFGQSMDGFVTSLSSDLMAPLTDSQEPNEDRLETDESEELYAMQEIEALEPGDDLLNLTLPSDARPEIVMKTYFPYNHQKGGVIPITGEPFQYKDSDTGFWTSVAEYHEGRLLQKRVSTEYGIMYDVRVVFPDGDIRKVKQIPAAGRVNKELVDEATAVPPEVANLTNAEPPVPPVMLFRWTLLPKGETTTLRADRWSRKQE